MNNFFTNTNNRPIVVFGMNGQLGSAFLEIANSPNILFLTSKDCDVRNQSEINHILDSKEPWLVINCTGYTMVDYAENDVRNAMDVNSNAPKYIAQWCNTSNAVMVHFSTDYVFDGNKSEPYCENDRPSPISVYGKSKLLGEIQVEKNLSEYLIFRISWVYSHYKNCNNFLKTIIKLAKEKEELRIVNDQIGSPSFAKDIANIVYEIIQPLKKIKDEKEFPYGIYHLSNLGSTSWYDFAKTIINELEEMGIPLKVKRITPILSKDYPTKAMRPLNSRLNTECIRRTFSVQPPHWVDALKRCLKLMVIDELNAP